MSADIATNRPDEVYFSPGEAILRKLSGLLGSVRESLDLCLFTISDDRLTRAILEAHEKGAKVRVITDNDKRHDAGSDIGAIIRAGVPVRADDGPEHMHHKFCLFDASCLATGSYNWTRGATANFENLLVTWSPATVGMFSGEFEELWRRMRRLQ
ncbi:MAG: hypothetical protein KJS91_01060 [Planctomycetes bacterium]|nr:hypothetical protein [Planctomycetota bacterium]